MRRDLVVILVGGLLLPAGAAQAQVVSVEGAPVDTGYNVGSTARIRATVHGAGDAGRYAVFADIQYVGTSSVASVEMNAQPAGPPGEIAYEVGWPVPGDAPTGLYSVNLRVEDRASRQTVATRQAAPFFAYKKLIAITRFALDKTFYAPGERIRCEVTLQNLTGQELRGLRVEFSNENYPWISTFSGRENAAGRMTANPSLGLVVLRAAQDLPARGEVTLPMGPAGTAAFLQGTQVAVMGAGGPARHFTLPPPEVDRYTLAVWNHDRTRLYDMQFSPQVVVRQPDRALPKPYSRNYTHPYNDEIDFSRYREFYPPGYVSPVIVLDHSHTLYRPGEKLMIDGLIKQPNWRQVHAQEVPEATLHVSIEDGAGKRVREVTSLQMRVAAGNEPPSRLVDGQINAPEQPGVYHVNLEASYGSGAETGDAKTEIAVNQLPASLLVFCPHEDDEHPWAGLTRAMVEAGLPVHVVFFTGGDVGECERYFGGHPCDPIRAREFGTVRMEESVEALEHLGVQRPNIIFLGLPDGGSGEIWFHHLAASNPFLDIYLAVDHAPYEDVYQPNLPYARDAVIEATKRILTEFHPAMIAVPHPDERHVDHRTANWFALQAAQELYKAGQLDAHTIVLADQAYGSGGYRPAPYQYEKYLVYLSGAAAVLKQEMGWIYQSQDGNLDEGAKKTFSQLPRQELHYRILDWQQHEGWNESPLAANH